MKGTFSLKLMSLCLVLALCVCAVSAFAAPAVPAGPITLDKTKKPVVFFFFLHKSVKCESCHHPVGGKEEFRPCATAGCHDILRMKDKSVNSYHRIRHAKDSKLPSCISCHTEVVAKAPEKKQALLGCKESKCHQ